MFELLIEVQNLLDSDTLANTSNANNMKVALLKILKANFRRLVASGIDSNTIGLNPDVISPILDILHASQLQGVNLPLRLEASEVLLAGFEVVMKSRSLRIEEMKNTIRK